MSRLKKLKVQQQELLPGIPDDITLDLITTKLAWSAVRKLALLSSGWQQAIQTREVYKARVRSNSTETLAFTEFRKLALLSSGWQQAIHTHEVYKARVRFNSTETLAFTEFQDILSEDVQSGSSEPDAKLCLYIYSSRDRVVHSLPSIPDHPEGITIPCQLASFDGKLYVLGGRTKTADKRVIISKKVYVLDLAGGQRQWKEVSSMQKPRPCFKAVVTDGKIYAFGGLTGSEVYDPKVNAWSIVPVYDPGLIMSMECSNELLPVDEGLWVFVGSGTDYSLWLKIFHPGRNDWRVVEHYRRDKNEAFFVAKGKLHSISKCNVNVFDIAKESWTLLHSFSFEEEYVDVFSVVALDSELLARVHWGDLETHMEECFIQSRGFGSKNERISWNKVCSTFDYNPFGPLVPVQL